MLKVKVKLKVFKQRNCNGYVQSAKLKKILKLVTIPHFLKPRFARVWVLPFKTCYQV